MIETNAYIRCYAGRVPIMDQYVSSNSNGGGCIIDPADPALTKQNPIHQGASRHESRLVEYAVHARIPSFCCFCCSEPAGLLQTSNVIIKLCFSRVLDTEESVQFKCHD